MLPAKTIIQGRYQIIEQIGQGGMGAIYKATDLRLRHIIALKQMLVEGETLRRAFEREAQLLAGLRHPALPRVSDHFADEHGQFLVMEFISGDDFATLLERRKFAPFPLQDVLNWTDRLLDALQYLHTHQPPIVHRDIKPQNMKLTDQGDVVLLDFGLAKGSTLAQTTMDRSIFGYTPQYAALEQMDGLGTDPRSDLYSLGATCYHLLTGTPPLNAKARAMDKVRDLPDPLVPIDTLNPLVPAPISAVVMLAMAQNPNLRPPSAATLRALLADAVQGRMPELRATTVSIPLKTVLLPAAPSILADARVLLDRGELEQAIIVLAAVPAQLLDVPAREMYARALMMHGKSKDRAGDLTGAITDYRSALEIAPPGPLRAELAQLAGDVTVAIESLPRPASVTAARQPSRTPLVIGGGVLALGLVVAGIGWASFGSPEPKPTATNGGVVSSVAPPQVTSAAVVPTFAPTLAPPTFAPTVAPTVDTAPTATAHALQVATVQAQQTAAAVVAQATAQVGAAPSEQAKRDRATSTYNPEMDTMLVTQVYEKNVFQLTNSRRALRANRSDPKNSALWARDLDYGVSGYSYVLGNMDVMRESLELLLSGIQANGVAPEVRFADNRGAIYGSTWDSMPNVINAVYVYVAKTGDRAFYQQHRDELQQLGTWITALDKNGDGLPDQDQFPFGFYNSVHNSVRHTYALAKFYAAYNELAELEAISGNPRAAEWQGRANQLHQSFHRSFAQGGYWLDDQDWPIAWLAADGTPINGLETFGVFEALRSGLISPADADHYTKLMDTLHTRLPDLLDGPTPMRLMLGGYPNSVQRTDVKPSVPKWMLDASSPWVVGLAAPAYAAHGNTDDAKKLLDAYTQMAQATADDGPPVLLFAAGPNAKYGAGDSKDRGVTLSSAAWFLALYEGHYGLRMTPAALIVQPHPFAIIPNDSISNLSYQGAVVQLQLDAAHKTYRIRADRPIVAKLLPMGTGTTQVRVDGGAPVPEATLLLEPNKEYVIVSQ